MAYSVSTVRTQESALQINRVLRNTYLLLAMTLVVSAGAAIAAMQTNAPHMGTLLFLAGAIGGQFVIMRLRNSGWGLLAVFAWTAFMGWAIGPMLNYYVQALSNGPQLVAMALGGTGVTFLAMSGIALVSKRDFSFLANMVFIGGLVAFGAALLAIFTSTPALMLAASSLFVLVAAGGMLWGTQAIIRGGVDNYIIATMYLYSNIWTLFVHLLNLLSFFLGED